MDPDKTPRFLAIDALRGVAAVAVVAFHLLRNSPQTDVLRDVIPQFAQVISDYGRDGVAVFFVISGFVIAYSTRSLPPTVGAGARFALRRQARLDPPYYVVIAGVLVIGAFESLVPTLVHQSFSARDVLINMFYLQGLLETPSILAVSWTLCYEVQFYLFGMVVLVVSGLLFRNPLRALERRRFRQVVLTAAGAVSLILPFTDIDPHHLFIAPWWLFFLGTVVCWYFLGEVGAPFVAACFLATFASLGYLEVNGAAAADPWRGGWVAFGTGLLLLALVVTQRLSWAPPRIVLFFGEISYSLYLVHLPVIETVMAAGFKLTGNSRPGALAFYVVGAASSVGAAVVLRKFVEQPAIRLADALKSRSLRFWVKDRDRVAPTPV